MKKNLMTIAGIIFIFLLGYAIFTPSISSGIILEDIFNKNILSGLSTSTDSITLIQKNSNLQLIDIRYNYDIKDIISGSETQEFSNKEEYPITPTRATIVLPVSKGDFALVWINFGLYIISFIIYIFFAVNFIIFLIRVNQYKIIYSKNMKSLARMTVLLFSIGIILTATGILSDLYFGSLNLNLTGVELSSNWELPFSPFLAALLFFIIYNILKGVETQLEESEDYDIKID